MMGGICFYKKCCCLYDVHGQNQEGANKGQYECKVFEARHYGKGEQSGKQEKQKPVKHS